MASQLSRRIDAIEPLIRAQSGTLEKSVYGVIDGVKRVDGKLVPNIVRRWEGSIGDMTPTDRDPTMLLVEKLEPFILKHKKYKALYGGRGGMKTRFAQGVFVADVNSNGTKCYVLRERMNSLKESIYSGIVSNISSLGIGGFMPVPSKWEIRNVNGGKFVFGGMQNIIDIKGSSDFKRFLMEEAEKTKQSTIDIIGPTLRGVDNAELWYLWNTGSSQDAMSKEFILPYQGQLDKCGYYEDEYHMIVKLTYEDNPWFEFDESLNQELQKDRSKVDRGIMTQARFNGIWKGEFNDDVATSVIQDKWFDACIDAHKKLGIEARGAIVSACDPSDVGSDPFGFVSKQGIVYFDVDEISGENGNRKMDEACKRAILNGSDSFGYDADGLGATLRDNVSLAYQGKPTQIYAYKGSSAIRMPEALFKSETAVLTNTSTILKNKDVLFNKKSQNVLSIAEKIFRTWEAVTPTEEHPNGKYHDPDTLISFDSSRIKPDMLRKLKAEACKTPTKSGPTVRFYTKPELRRGIPLPDGSTVVIPSPNLFDAVQVCEDEGGIIIAREDLDMTALRSTKVNYW